MVQVKAPKGVNDILPAEIHLWRYMEDTLRTASERSGFAIGLERLLLLL